MPPPSDTKRTEPGASPDEFRSLDEGGFDRLLSALPRERSALLPALLLTQRRLGTVPDWAVERIAAHLRLTVNDVEGVVTGYPDLRRNPTGARVVRVCTGLGCWTAGADRLTAALTAALGIRLGQTTPDGAIALEETPCCFLCGVAPVVDVDGVRHGRVNADAIAAFVTAGAPLSRAGAEGCSE